jgi:Zn ribbon nucleic-acid-binding protein
VGEWIKMAGIQDYTTCPCCDNDEATYYYDSWDREETINCSECGYEASQTMSEEFERRRRTEGSLSGGFYR